MSTVYVIVSVDKVSKLLCERISGWSGGTLLMAIYISTGLRRPRECMQSGYRYLSEKATQGTRHIQVLERLPRGSDYTSLGQLHHNSCIATACIILYGYTAVYIITKKVRQVDTNVLRVTRIHEICVIVYFPVHSIAKACYTIRLYGRYPKEDSLLKMNSRATDLDHCPFEVLVSVRNWCLRVVARRYGPIYYFNSSQWLLLLKSVIK